MHKDVDIRAVSHENTFPQPHMLRNNVKMEYLFLCLEAVRLVKRKRAT